MKSGSTSDKPPVIVIAGPTASGKSAAALRVAETYGGVVINADSMQVYRELPVLTAQPAPADQARVPHRLYGSMSATERCTAGRWRSLALAEIEAAYSSGRMPIIVGGTGLYLKALMEGLAPVPPIPAEVRARARALFDELGPPRFHAELGRIDPAMAARVSATDTQRMLRAYEVVTATGTSLATFQRENQQAGMAFLPVLLLPPRGQLHAVIDARCRSMVESGAIEEVRRLLSLQLDASLPAMKAVGVREFARHIAGELTAEEAIALFQKETRRYLKRQYTWFRNQMSGAHVIDAQFSESIEAEIFSFIRKSIDRLGTDG